jgi:hypothetical protein
MASTSVVEPPCESLTTLLSRVAASPEQTRRLHALLGPYCHQAKNLLNGINLSQYLARRDLSPSDLVVWTALEALYLEAEGFVDRVQQICRPIPLYLVRNSLGLLFESRSEAWTELLARSERRLIVAPPAEPAVGEFDPARLEKGFNDLVSWRAWAGSPRTDLRVSWTVKRGAFLVAWDEPVRRPRSSRLSALRQDTISVLAIPLLARIAAQHAGTVCVSDAPRWRLRMSWPLDVRHSLRDPS